MHLEIVWRNSEGRSPNLAKLERLVRDEYGSLYAVRRDGEVRTFELFAGCALRIHLSSGEHAWRQIQDSCRN